MGESFDKEIPISDETMDKIEDVQSYDDMKKYDLADFPYDYLKVDRSEIDNISKDDLPFIKVLNDLTYDDGNKMVEEVEGITHEEAEESLNRLKSNANEWKGRMVKKLSLAAGFAVAAENGIEEV